MTFLVWVYTSQDFVQTQQNFARSRDRTTVTFRSSAFEIPLIPQKAPQYHPQQQTWNNLSTLPKLLKLNILPPDLSVRWAPEVTRNHQEHYFHDPVSATLLIIPHVYTYTYTIY